MTTTTKPSAQAGRARLIVEIHVARRDLERAGRLDEPGYRELLRAASKGRHDSAKDMSYTDLKAAMVLFEKAGFVKRRAPSKRPLASAPEDRKVRALWLFLHALGIVKDPSEKALAAYVKRVAKVDDLRWVNSAGSLALIESLKMWAMRLLPAIVYELRTEVAEADHAGMLKPEQIEHALAAQSFLARGEGFDVYWGAWEHFMTALGRPIAAELAGMPVAAAREPRR